VFLAERVLGLERRLRCPECDAKGIGGVNQVGGDELSIGYLPY
jgi:hypothetical protein